MRLYFKIVCQSTIILNILYITYLNGCSERIILYAIRLFDGDNAYCAIVGVVFF